MASAGSSMKRVESLNGNGDSSGSRRSGWTPARLPPTPSRDSRTVNQTTFQKKKFNDVTYRGTVSYVNYERGFGKLVPETVSTNQSSVTESTSKDVHFKVALGANQCSSTMTGGMTLIEGDILRYVLQDFSKERPSTRRATLCKCRARKMDKVVDYVKSLVARAQDHPHDVLRSVTSCPAALKYVLDYENPSRELSKHVLDLCHILQSNSSSEVYSSRLAQMYTLFGESQFLISEAGVQKYAIIYAGDDNLKELLKEMLIHLLERDPSQLRTILPLVERLGVCEKPRTSTDSMVSTNLETSEQVQNLPLRCDGVSFVTRILNVVASGRSQIPGSRCWAKFPLLPTMEEMRSGCYSSLPVVRKKGNYGSTDDYLDTYFRLLRADCFAELLQGIQAFRQGKLDNLDIKMWFTVTVVGVHFSLFKPRGLTFALSLPPKGKVATKAPLNGSLVCISGDGGRFDMPIWGVVRQCEAESPKVCVCFVEIIVQSGGTELSCDDSLSVQYARLMNGENLMMAESPTAYFAYQPVLDALQRTDPQRIPFQDELVFVTWPRKAPEYLTSPSTKLDWSCIFDLPETQGYYRRCISFAADESTPCASYAGENWEGIGGVASLQGKGYKTSFDASQLKAVELALNNRLTMIQGPPGTGKTYIACKLLQLLLSANTFPEESPVLVMTYKNHALDQFLEKCLTFCAQDSIVRVGGKSSQIAEIEKCNLRYKVDRNDEFNDELSENRRKAMEMQQDMEVALKEYQKRVLNFDPVMIITSGQPDLRYFINRVCNLGRVQTLCSRLLPEGSTVAELLVQDQFSEDADPKWVADLKWLNKSLVLEIKRWIPKPEVLYCTLNCFSTKKPAGFANQSDFFVANNVTDGEALSTAADSNDVLDDGEEEERRSAYESMRKDAELEELDPKSTHFDSRTKSNERKWLENDFVAFSTKGNAQKAPVAFSHLENLDGKYDWVAEGDPYSLSPEHRAILVLKCWQRSVDEAWQRFASIKSKYDNVLQDTEEITKRRNLAIFKKAKIIFMTTTGAATHQSVLRCLSPAVILVEEAAEILEPNVLAVLHSNLQHLILIGDHQQLRPQVASYPLERWHGFSVSMFERLVEHNKLPFQHLNQQSRMREEFVPMLLPIYPFLKSHKANVSGLRNKEPAYMEKTMHFWTHTFPELSQRSYTNAKEAEMVVALARWIVSEIGITQKVTIIAAYSSQVKVIQRLLDVPPDSARDGSPDHPKLQGTAVYTIDKFQGAENEIVIVSLVRSNDTRKIGFLSARSRLCVAVSRARAGVYLVGNSTTLTQSSADWRTLVSYFESQNAISSSIHLRCPRHPNLPTFELTNNTASQFKRSDVCRHECLTELPCGHSCVRSCHSGPHSSPCKQIVRVTLGLCGHDVEKMCYEDEYDLRCMTKVMHTFDKCSHTTLLACWEVKGRKESDLACKKDCEKERECGHMCTSWCSEICEATPCTSCIEIEKEKERIKKEIQAKAREEELRKLEIEIKALGATTNGGLLLHEVHPSGDSAEDFHMAKGRVEKSCHPHSNNVFVVTSVEKVENLKLQRKFLEAQKDIFSPQEIRKWLFYGGSDDQLRHFAQKGFKVPKQQEYRFEAYSSTAGKSHGKLLLCEVQLGRTWRNPDATYLTPDKLRLHGYDSVSKVADQAGELGEAYEHVIYNPDLAIPRFLVSYRLEVLEEGVENFGESQARESRENFCRIPLMPAASFREGNPGDLHFRMAESQFFRMSKNRSYKVTMVELIVNLDLKEKYLGKKKEFERESVSHEEIFVFHGTDSIAIDKIAREGFKIGGTEGVAMKSGAAYGSGVYTAVNPDISVEYSRGSNMMLLSRCIKGSHGLHHTHGGGNDVLVIKNVSQLLPRYVVHYS